MEKYKFEKTLKEGVLRGRINGYASIIIDGEEKKVRCHAWGKISTIGEGLPCLVLENADADPEHTVVAVSFDNRGTERRWTCISPALLEQAVGYFLKNNQMEDMVGGDDRTSSLLKTRMYGPDYQMGNACIEVRLLGRSSNAISACNRWSLISAMRQAEKHYKRLATMQKTGEKMILLLVNQYGEEEILSDNKAKKIVDRVIQEDVEIWVANLQFDSAGITLQSYLNVKDMISKNQSD